MYTIKVHPVMYPKFNTNENKRPEYIKRKKEEPQEFRKALEKYSQLKHSILDIRV